MFDSFRVFVWDLSYHWQKFVFLLHYISCKDCRHPAFVSPLLLSGNAAVIKPSEVSSHSAKVMEELLPQYLDKVSLLLCLI